LERFTIDLTERAEQGKLDRRLIQLEIQREALKKEKDKASKQRLKDLESEIGELEREFADLEEILSGTFGPGDTIAVGIADGKLMFLSPAIDAPTGS